MWASLSNIKSRLPRTLHKTFYRPNEPDRVRPSLTSPIWECWSNFVEELPTWVRGSLRTWTSIMVPYWPKYSRSLSADVCQLSPPTKSLLCGRSVGVERPDELLWSKASPLIATSVFMPRPAEPLLLLSIPVLHRQVFFFCFLFRPTKCRRREKSRREKKTKQKG